MSDSDNATEHPRRLTGIDRDGNAVDEVLPSMTTVVDPAAPDAWAIDLLDTLDDDELVESDHAALIKAAWQRPSDRAAARAAAREAARAARDSRAAVRHSRRTPR